MQLTGQAVQHAAFGRGVVTDQRDNIITVSFSQGEKRFVYPDAFKKFLTLNNEKAAEKVDALLERHKEQREEKIQALLDEQERQQKLHNFKISINSQAVFALEMEGQKDALQCWQVSTGTYLTGCAKGEPRIPDKMKPNSVCLLTVRPEGALEAERRIAGAFMVQEDFFGEECADGLITAHPQYRVTVPEKLRPLYWEYFKNARSKSRWGSVGFRYCNNVVMQRILLDLRNALKETDAADAADAFYTYYCRQNQLNGLPTV